MSDHDDFDPSDDFEQPEEGPEEGSEEGLEEALPVGDEDDDRSEPGFELVESGGDGGGEDFAAFAERQVAENHETPDATLDDKDDPSLHHANVWVGAEFLLWLWYQVELRYSALQLPRFGKVEVWFDDLMRFRQRGEKGQTLELKGGAPSTTLEAKTALAEKRLIQRARIGVRLEDREYFFTINAETFDLSGLKLPEVVKDGGEEVLIERMALVEEITSIVEMMLKQFAAARVGASWPAELARIRRWIHRDEFEG